MRTTIVSVWGMLFVVLSVAGCPAMVPADSEGQSGQPLPAPQAVDLSASGGIVPATYIGTHTGSTTNNLAGEDVETPFSNDIAIIVAQDGTVTINGAEYSVGQLLGSTVDGPTVTRLNVRNVSVSSTSILIQSDYSVDFQDLGLLYTGTRNITLRRIDDTSIAYSDRIDTSTSQLGDVIYIIQESSGTLQR